MAALRVVLPILAVGIIGLPGWRSGAVPAIPAVRPDLASLDRAMRTAPDPPLPGVRVCEIGRTDLDVLHGLPADARGRIDGLSAAQLPVRSRSSVARGVTAGTRQTP